MSALKGWIKAYIHGVDEAVGLLLSAIAQLWPQRSAYL